MRHDLELELWQHVVAGGRPRDWITKALERGAINSPKQPWRTLEKWGSLYGYGVALDLGWIDPEIPEAHRASPHTAASWVRRGCTVVA